MAKLYMGRGEHSVNGLELIVESFREDNEALRRQIKELRHELTMQIGVEGFRVRDIAIAALEKLASDNSPPWDSLNWKYVAKEALKEIKGGK